MVLIIREVAQDAIQLPSTSSDVRAFWSQHVNDKEASIQDHILYFILRSVLAKGEYTHEQIIHRIKTGFTPVSNKIKLENGRRAYDTLYLAFGSMYTRSYFDKHIRKFDVDSNTADNAFFLFRTLLPLMRLYD